MLSSTPFFARTTSWLYKAYHLVLIMSGENRGETNVPVVLGIALGMGLVVAVCVMPSIVHPVRDRATTNALLVQTVLMLSAINMGVHVTLSRGTPAMAALWVQLLTGHVFYSLAIACLDNKHIVVGAPFVTIVVGAAALALPLAACMTAPRPPEVHGLALVLALGTGELCGVTVFCLSQMVHAGGNAYEYVVRMLCE